jgi:DinB superfamily
LMDRLASTLEELPRMVRSFGDAALRRPAAQAAVGVETFSAIGHACHLRDIEVEGYQVRIRRLRAEDHPMLESLDGERLGVERGYDRDDRDVALAAFVAARRRSLDLLRSVDGDEWGRSGIFEGYGEVSLRGLVDIMVEHDAGHLGAILTLPRT